MKKNKETAEQKLLKMIESEDGGSSTKAQQVVQKENTLVLVKSVNKFLIIGLIASLVFMAYHIKSGTDFLAQSVSYSVKGSAKRALSVTDLIPTVQRLSFYLTVISKRNIFVPYEDKPKAGIKAQHEKDREIVRKTKSLKLVGISWFDRVDTASAMIEDIEKEETYFLKKGEKINNLTINTIYADSIELSDGNEEIIIKYDKSNM
jgi:hypothetical protein